MKKLSWNRPQAPHQRFVEAIVDEAIQWLIIIGFAIIGFLFYQVATGA